MGQLYPTNERIEMKAVQNINKDFQDLFVVKSSYRN